MYIYIDENNYVYGYGSEQIENSIEVESIPKEVDDYLGAYKLIDDEYVVDQERVDYLIFLNDTEVELVQVSRWLTEDYIAQITMYERQKRQGKDVDAIINELDSQYDVYAELKESLLERLAMRFDQWKEYISKAQEVNALAYIVTIATSVASAMLIFILQSLIKENRKLKKEKEESEKQKESALETGVRQLLSVALEELYNMYAESDSIPRRAYERWKKLHGAYKGLHGNGTFTHMDSEMDEKHII